MSQSRSGERANRMPSAGRRILGPAAMLLLATACRGPAMPVTPVHPTDTTHVLFRPVRSEARVEAILRRIGARVDSGPSPSPRDPLLAWVQAMAQPPEPGAPRIMHAESKTIESQVWIGGRRVPLFIQIFGLRGPARMLSVSSNDAEVAERLREAWRDDRAAEAIPMGPVAVVIAERTRRDSSPELVASIRTLAMYSCLGHFIVTGVDSTGPVRRLLLHGINSDQDICPAAIGPATANVPLPFALGRSEFDVLVGGHATRLRLDITEETRRLKVVSGSSAVADDRPHWRPPIGTVVMACTGDPWHEHACDDVIDWLRRVPGWHQLRVPDGAVNAFAEGWSFSPRSMWQIRDTASMKVVRSCLSAVVPRLPFGSRFDVIVRGLDDFRLDVRGREADEREQHRPAATVLLSLAHAFRTETACQFP